MSVGKLMSDNQIPIRKFLQLLNYIEAIGLDPVQLASSVDLSYDDISTLDENLQLPSLYYSLLYREAVLQMQTLDASLPWAAGLGSDAFRLMCYCMISSKTLGAALAKAQEFDQLVYPLVGHKISLELESGKAKVRYQIKTSESSSIFAPDSWDRSSYLEAVAKTSGLEMWFGLCGWLIAQTIELDEVRISASSVSDSYKQRTINLFACPIHFDAEENSLTFSQEYLSYRLVHSADSLEVFLNTGPYQLWALDNKPASTSAAIKTLIGTEFQQGLPSFEQMADNMHMSPSSLRRHLRKENTSYQKIKDECRRRVAIELLCASDNKIGDVGDQLGFTDTSSFVRSFRSWTGMTPKAYRNSVINLGGNSEK